MNFSLQKFITAYSVGVVKSEYVNRNVSFFRWQNWDVSSTQTMGDLWLMIVHLLQPFRDAFYSNAQPWKIPKAVPDFSRVGCMAAALWCGRSCDWMVVVVLPITNSISLWFVAICGGKTFNFFGSECDCAYNQLQLQFQLSSSSFNFSYKFICSIIHTLFVWKGFLDFQPPPTLIFPCSKHLSAALRWSGSLVC